MPGMTGEMMPRLIGWQMEKLKGPMETLQRRLEAIQERRKKAEPAAERQG